MKSFITVSGDWFNYRYMYVLLFWKPTHNLIKNNNNYNGTESLLDKIALTKLERIGSSELITIYSLLGLSIKRGVWWPGGKRKEEPLSNISPNESPTSEWDESNKKPTLLKVLNSDQILHYTDYTVTAPYALPLSLDFMYVGPDKLCRVRDLGCLVHPSPAPRKYHYNFLKTKQQQKILFKNAKNIIYFWASETIANIFLFLHFCILYCFYIAR